MGGVEMTLMRYAAAGMTLASLTACGGRQAAPVETRVQIERVMVRAPCPERSIYEDLMRELPRPLRTKPMPADADVRNAQTQAQLGKYEAPGAWAEKAVAALDRCQRGEDLTPAPEPK
jgi:hypothetical protein